MNPLDRAMESGAPIDVPSRNGGTPTAAAGDPAATVFEPPSGIVVDAIRYHKLLVAAIAIACALIGAGIGLLRQPVYSASATLQVGEVNPNSPGFGSFTQSTTSLATAFSRSIAAAPVLTEIEKKLGLAPQTSASRLSAEPIPLSPVFRVVATGPSESAALKLANVSAGAVVTYVTKSNSSDPQSTALLNRYRAAALGVRKAQAKVKGLESGSRTSPKLLHAEAALSTAQVKLEAISRSYVSSVASQAPRHGLVSVLAGATTASSDRKSKIELYAFIGLLVGLVLGAAAAVWRERRLLPSGPQQTDPLSPRPD